MICVLIVLSCAVFTRSQTAPAKEPTSTISGKVTMKDKPLAGVAINLRSNERSPQKRRASYKARTDVNGEYRIMNVPAGNYVVAPLAPAFVSEGDTRTLIVNKGETIEHIDFSLSPGGVITGKVVDADGRPVIEEDVVVFSASNAERFAPRIRESRTDDRGVYRIFGLRPGSYKVAAGQGENDRYGGYGRTTFKRAFHPATPDAAQATVIEVSEGGEVTNVDIMLGRGLTSYSASGRIVDAQTGQPLANVGYGMVHYVGPSSTSSMSTGAVSNSRGEFRLDNLVPGKYAVQIRAQAGTSWRADDVPFEVVDEDVTDVVVRASKGATISGVVVLEGTADKSARDDLSRMMITGLTELREDKPFGVWSRIGADGAFTLSGLAGGTAVLRLGSSDRFRISRIERNGVVQGRGVEVREGETITDVRIFLTYNNASIRGLIEVANGTIPAGSRFYVSLRNLADDPAGPGSNAPTEVDARGQFVIEGLMPGTYEINAGVVSEGARTTLIGSKKQQVVVNANSVNNITISVELNANPPKP